MTTPSTHVTCLLTLLRACTPEERDWLAAQAGTTVNYLYSAAGCSRSQMRVGLAVSIEDASRALHDTTHGRTPIVTARELATMCSYVGIGAGD